jgi:hypothetical protein
VVRVYLDATPVIYAVEQVPGYGAAVDARLAAPGVSASHRLAAGTRHLVVWGFAPHSL